MQGLGHGGFSLFALPPPSLRLRCLCAVSRPHAPAGASSRLGGPSRSESAPSAVICTSAAPRHPGMGQLSLTAFPTCL